MPNLNFLYFCQLEVTGNLYDLLGILFALGFFD
jgi:hypothetical protein